MDLKIEITYDDLYPLPSFSCFLVKFCLCAQSVLFLLEAKSLERRRSCFPLLLKNISSLIVNLYVDIYKQ